MTWIPVKTSPRVAARVLAALLLAATACGARQGALPECIQESDCPSSGDECNPTRCFNHTCRPGSVPGGGLVGVQPPCQRRYCNTNGQVVVGPDPAACLPEAPDLVSSPVEGTAPVMLQGRYLAGATVSVDGVTVPSTSSADGTSLTFTPPPQPLGRTLLALQNANGRSTHAFFRVARLPAGRTLVADGALDDWPADYLAMAADLPPDPTPADALRRLLVAYDDAGLWLGVDGATATSPANGLLLYLEPFVAFVGITPGPRDLRTLTDASNPLSDACASSIQLDAPDWYFPNAPEPRAWRRWASARGFQPPGWRASAT